MTESYLNRPVSNALTMRHGTTSEEAEETVCVELGR